MEARALTRHEKASLRSFLSGVYAGVICVWSITDAGVVLV